MLLNNLGGFSSFGFLKYSIQPALNPKLPIRLIARNYERVVAAMSIIRNYR